MMVIRFTWLFNKHIIITPSVTVRTSITKNVTQGGLAVKLPLSAQGMRKAYSVKEFDKRIFRKGNAFSTPQVLGNTGFEVGGNLSMHTLYFYGNLSYDILQLSPLFCVLGVFAGEV